MASGDLLHARGRERASDCHTCGAHILLVADGARRDHLVLRRARAARAHVADKSLGGYMAFEPTRRGARFMLLAGHGHVPMIDDHRARHSRATRGTILEGDRVTLDA